jgi:hypothetical protein
MDNPARELIEALHSAAELEFWRVPETNFVQRVPLTIWRYAREAENRLHIDSVTELLTEACQNRRILWEIRPPGKAGRNWVLAPKKFLEIEDSGRFRLFPEILDHLEEAEPDLGSAANADLRDIAGCFVSTLTAWRNAQH